MTARTTSEAPTDDSAMDPPSLTRTLSESPEDEITEAKPKPDTKKKKERPAKAEGDTEAPKRAKRPKKEPGEPQQGQPPADSSDQPKSKRGQARPHRRLETEIITARIEKLDKRIKRATAQVVDASRNLEGYRREMTFRPAEKSLEDKLEESLEEKSGA